MKILSSKENQKEIQKPFSFIKNNIIVKLKRISINYYCRNFIKFILQNFSEIKIWIYQIYSKKASKQSAV